MQVKLMFGSETKKIKRPESFNALFEITTRLFPNCPASPKFFYVDSEGDLISISNNDDLEEALQQIELKVLKVLVQESSEKAKEWLADNQNLMRSSIIGLPFQHSIDSGRRYSQNESEAQNEQQQKQVHPLSVGVFEYSQPADPFQTSSQIGYEVFDPISTQPLVQNNQIQEPLDSKYEEPIFKEECNLPLQMPSSLPSDTAGKLNQEAIDALYQQYQQDSSSFLGVSQLKEEIWKQRIEEDPLLENQPSSFFQNFSPEQRPSNAGESSLLRQEQEGEVQTMLCFECRGAGLVVDPAEMQSAQCGRCGGKGKIGQIEIRDLVQLVKSDNLGIFEPVLQRYRQMKGEKKQEVGVSHIGYQCDKCQVNPIPGIRYTCLICENLNFCKQCEKSEGLIHRHPLVKIRNPAHEQVAQSLCQSSHRRPPDAQLDFFSGPLQKSEYLEERSGSLQESLAAGLKQKLEEAAAVKVRLREKPSVLKMQPGEERVVELIFEVQGRKDSLQLVRTNGAVLTEEVVCLMERGEDMRALLKVKAPPQAGKHCSFFQIRLEKKLKVGPKIYVEVEVERDQREEEEKERANKRKAVEEAEKARKLAEYDQFMNMYKFSGPRRKNMNELRDMGFLNCKVNNEMCNKYKDKLLEVIEALSFAGL